MVDSMFWTNLVEQLDERSLEKLGLNASETFLDELLSKDLDAHVFENGLSRFWLCTGDYKGKSAWML